MYQRRRECASIGEQLDRDGYMVIKDFLLPVECDEIIQAGQKLANDLPEQADRSIFSTIENDKQQLRDQHFLESNDKISYFFEKDAVGPTGDLQVHPSVSLNKLGHALHLLHPLFRCYTYCDRVQSLCRILGYKEPAVVQSMYIYKNPHIGAEVSPHQDGTYLYSSPIPVLGLWIALEDATVRNGCLWVVKGSHKSGLHRRLIRNPDKTGPMLIYDRPAPIYPQSSFIPIPVEKGSLVLINGNLVHKSEKNNSEFARPAYTFHIVEKNENDYAEDNWLQEGVQAPFSNMYLTRQVYTEDGDS